MGTYVDAKGPTPGSKGVMKLHHGMASGFDMPKTERRVKTFQAESETGDNEAPGLTTRNVKAKNCG